MFSDEFTFPGTCVEETFAVGVCEYWFKSNSTTFAITFAVQREADATGSFCAVDARNDSALFDSSQYLHTTTSQAYELHCCVQN